LRRTGFAFCGLFDARTDAHESDLTGRACAHDVPLVASANEADIVLCIRRRGGKCERAAVESS
jgi:hypothetical protein